MDNQLKLKEKFWRFLPLTTVASDNTFTEIPAFWDRTSCSLVICHWRCVRACSFYFQANQRRITCCSNYVRKEWVRR